MAYVDYQFYTDVFHGAMSEADFNRFLLTASYKLESITFDRVKKLDLTDADIAERIGMAVCTLIESMFFSHQTGGKEISLEIVGHHHVSYVEAKTSAQARLIASVRPYLSGIMVDGVSLLYRGVGGCCR